jgi:hypothetical protein
VIIRVLGEGQWRVDEATVDQLNELDGAVEAAVDTDDEPAFASALRDLLGAVREKGTPVPDDELVDSDLVLPPADATTDDVRHLLTDEGLIPG